MKNKAVYKISILYLIFMSSILISCNSTSNLNKKTDIECLLVSQVGDYIFDKSNFETKQFLSSKKTVSFLVIITRDSYGGSINQYKYGFVENDSVSIWDNDKFNFIDEVKVENFNEIFPKENTLKSIECEDTFKSSPSYNYFVRYDDVIVNLSTSLKFRELPLKYQGDLAIFSLFKNVIK